LEDTSQSLKLLENLAKFATVTGRRSGAPRPRVVLVSPAKRKPFSAAASLPAVAARLREPRQVARKFSLSRFAASAAQVN